MKIKNVALTTILLLDPTKIQKKYLCKNFDEKLLADEKIIRPF